MYLTISRVLLLAASAALIAGCSSSPGAAQATATNAAGAPRTPVITAPVLPPSAGPTGPPVVAISALPPVPVAKPSDFGNGLVATVASITDVPTLQVQQPGDIAGPGVSVTIDMHNTSKGPVDLGGVDVNASYRDGTPANSNQSPPAAPLKGMLAAGQDQQGVYVFQVPTADAHSVVVQIAWNGSPNVVLVQR